MLTEQTKRWRNSQSGILLLKYTVDSGILNKEVVQKQIDTAKRKGEEY